MYLRTPTAWSGQRILLNVVLGWNLCPFFFIRSFAARCVPFLYCTRAWRCSWLEDSSSATWWHLHIQNTSRFGMVKNLRISSSLTKAWYICLIPWFIRASAIFSKFAGLKLTSCKSFVYSLLLSFEVEAMLKKMFHFWICWYNWLRHKLTFF